MNTKSTISFEEAYLIALKQAESILSFYLKSADIPVLTQHFMEAPYCWMFFRNKEIIIPKEHSLADGAYVVSKKGSFRHVADFSSEPEKLQAYLLTMSNHFKEKGE